MDFLPALCPILLASRADRAVRIFGEMCPQVVLRELPIYEPVDLLPVGRVRDDTELSARLLLPLHYDRQVSSFLRSQVAPLSYLRRCQDPQVRA